MNQLRTVPIRRSLIRPQLVGGAERELFLMLGLIVATLIFVSLTWATAFAGIGLWVIGVFVLRMMANADPLMSKVYARHTKYQEFYPARSTPYME